MTNKLDFVTGDWVVRVEQLHLEHRKSKEVTPLEPRLASLLTSLVSRKGQLVTKEVLLEEVWQGAVVSDDSIAQAVSRLRKILGDDPKSPRYVQTVWKKGYRWLCVVEQATLEHSPAQPKNWLWLNVVGLILLILLIVLWPAKPPAIEPQLLEARPLTAMPGMEYKGALSPDGNHVVFQSLAPEATDIAIMIQDMTGSTLNPLVKPGHHFTPVFSNDGNRIAYMKNEGEQCDIVIKGLVSGKDTRTLDCSGSVYPDLDWHEPTKRFVFGARIDKGQPVAIYSHSYAGANYAQESAERIQLTTPGAGAWGDFDPAISPDGELMVFTRAYTEMQHDLFLLNLNDGNTQRLTTQRAAIMGSSWTPDGKSLVFAARFRVGYRLYKLTLDSLSVSRVNVAATEIIEPHISNSGDMVATVRNFDTDLYQVDLSSGQSSILFDSTHWDLSPTISPDEKYFVFTSDRNGSFELWLGDVEQGTTRPLTAFDRSYVVAPNFSPDSQRVVFEVHDGDHSQIYTYDLTSSLLLKLTDGESMNVVPSISNTGSAIYFGSNRSGTWQIWRKPLDGGVATQVTKDGGYAGFESIDGQWLYFNKRNEAGIWRQDLLHGDVKLVTDRLGVDDVSAFALNQKGLYYLDRTQGQYGSIMLLQSSGDAKSVYTLKSAIPRFDPVLGINFSGEHLYLVKQNPISADLVKIDQAFKP